MKVLKDGKIGDLKKWKAEVVCQERKTRGVPGCGAVLEIDMEDILWVYHKYTPGGTHGHYFGIRCPQCGKYNWIGHTVSDLLLVHLNEKFKGKRGIFDGTEEYVGSDD